MKKDYIKSIAVLGAICLVIAALLATVNYFTAPVIKENSAAKENASLSEVLPGSKKFKAEKLPEGAAESVTGIYTDEGGAGYAVTLSASSAYSGSPMTFTLGVDADGKVVGVKITHYSETKDFGSDYPDSYIGADAVSAGDVDLAAGVTYSSTAFREAVCDALEAVDMIREGRG